MCNLSLLCMLCCSFQAAASVLVIFTGISWMLSVGAPWDLSAGTGKHCIFWSLRIVVWFSVFCLFCFT